jgi:hypothetical protein
LDHRVKGDIVRGRVGGGRRRIEERGGEEEITIWHADLILKGICIELIYLEVLKDLKTLKIHF